MSRISFTTTLDENLLKQAKIKAIDLNKRGVNDVIEIALEKFLSSDNPNNNQIGSEDNG